MLVVVEHRNVHALGEFLLNVEALGRLDVFQVDAAQGGLHRRDDLDQLVRIAFGQFDVEHVHAGKLFEQAALAFHHRLGGQRADIAQAQHGGAVGDHAHQVGTGGEFSGLRGIGFDVQAGVSHARRVGQRQIALVGQGLGGGDGDLAFVGAAVVFAGRVAQGLFSGGQVLCHRKISTKKLGAVWKLT